MSYSKRYALEWEALELLRSCLPASVMVSTSGSFRRTAQGAQGMGLLAGLKSTHGLHLVVNEPVLDRELLSVPGIRIVPESQYSGDWVSEIPGLCGLRSLLEIAAPGGAELVDSVHIIRDTVRWKSRIEGRVVDVSTDIGLMFGVGDERFLVLARDSDAGLLHFAWVRDEKELSWWFSPAGVRAHWAFDDSYDGQEVLHVERRTLQI